MEEIRVVRRNIQIRRKLVELEISYLYSSNLYVYRLVKPVSLHLQTGKLWVSNAIVCTLI